MKTLKTKFFALAFLALGFTALTTSCSDEKEPGTTTYSSENVAGTYIGKHNLNIPSNILKALSDALPVDSATGEKPDLTEGFDDTLIVSVDGNTVIVQSLLLDQTVNGKLTGNNKVKIDKKEFAELSLGSAVTAKGASVSTSKDVVFNAGTPTNVELRLTAKSIATFTIPLDITTTGSFVRQ